VLHLFARAGGIVAPHGAGLANLVAARAGTHVRHVYRQIFNFKLAGNQICYSSFLTLLVEIMLWSKTALPESFILEVFPFKIVAPHGAGLANLIAARAGTHVSSPVSWASHEGHVVFVRRKDPLLLSLSLYLSRSFSLSLNASFDVYATPTVVSL